MCWPFRATGWNSGLLPSRYLFNGVFPSVLSPSCLGAPCLLSTAPVGQSRWKLPICLHPQHSIFCKFGGLLLSLLSFLLSSLISPKRLTMMASTSCNNTRCYTGPYMGNGVILTYIADWPNSGKQAAWLRQCKGKYTHFTKLPQWQKRWYVLEHMCQYTSTHALQNMWQTYAETARMSVKQALFVIDYQIPAVWQLPWWGHQTVIIS